MSVSLAVDAVVRAGIALVTARVRNPTPAARQVRVVNRLDGPVLPPRRNGVPAVGWDDDGVTTVVDAEDTVALGYACPVGECDRTDQPADLVDVDDPDGRIDDAVSRTRRELGEFRPPRDSVPSDASSRAIDDSGLGRSNEFGAEPSDDGSTGIVTDEVDPEELPDSVDEYLARVAERVAVAEQLTGASVSEATATLDDCTADVPNLPDRLSTDAEALTHLAKRAESLAARAEATDVPVTALERVA